MAALGGMLAAAILKVVGDQIGSVIGGQIKLHKNFNKDLKKMKLALESVDALLEDAGRRSVTDKSTLLWLKRLTDAMYAISDMIDEFEADAEAVSQPSARKSAFKKYLAIMIPCLTMGPKITMVNKMDKMRQDLEVITDQHKNFRLLEGTNANEPKLTDIRETSSTLETQIIGRSKEKDEILASLFDSITEHITVLPIYGIGGLGKTTLAKLVYNSSQFKEYTQVWVYVSQKFDLKEIGNSIISQLAEKDERKHTVIQMIHNSLQKILDNKKILIVLDDLWEGDEFHLESLMDMLRVGKGGNVVVIVTTRDESIAQKISTIQPYKLSPLTDEMCWSIIRQKSAFESRGDKEQLEHIGKDIALKCAGVALAAKSLGHMLKSMKFGEWESVRDSDIWNLSSLKDASSSQVLASLKLSYSVMPSYLKLCFAYCAIFPKGHKIVKDDLIHQWVSLGFSNWQLAERYIRQLLGLSFLEHSKSPSTIKLCDEGITLFTMHDLVHDLARSVMDGEILVFGNGDNIDRSCYHYALLDDYSKPYNVKSVQEAQRINLTGKQKLEDLKLEWTRDAERFVDHKILMENLVPPSTLKKLEICGYSGASFPAWLVGQLPNLENLVFRGMANLEEWNTSCSSGEEHVIWKLEIHDCPLLKMKPLPPKAREWVISNSDNVLSAWEECTRSHTNATSSFSPSTIELSVEHCKVPLHQWRLLQHLPGLYYLTIKSCRDLTGSPEVIRHLSFLKTLKLQDQDLEELPKWLNENKKQLKLQSLILCGCNSMASLPHWLGELTSLNVLALSTCAVLSSLPESLQKLTALQTLHISDCPELKCLVERVCPLPSSLEKLRILFCNGIKSLPEGMEQLTNLQELYIYMCPGLNQWCELEEKKMKNKMKWFT